MNQKKIIFAQFELTFPRKILFHTVNANILGNRNKHDHKNTIRNFTLSNIENPRVSHPLKVRYPQLSATSRSFISPQVCRFADPLIVVLLVNYI